MNQSGSHQQPEFASAEECRAWLKAAPLASAAQAQAQMLRQMNLLNRHPLAAAERLDILELLRKPLHAAQEEVARRFAGKPLPLAPAEQAAFDACKALWQGLLTGYRQCLEAARAGEAALLPRSALILQRALAVLADAQADEYRAGFQVPASHWQAIHELYALAEEFGVAEQVVDDTVRLGRNPATPAAAYVESLLLQAASPQELNLRQLGWLARWARRWSSKVRVLASAPTLSTRAIPLCVDLAAAEPAHYRPLGCDSARWLDTATLRQSLKKRLNLLDQGAAPGEIQLGEDCLQPACGETLKHIYHRWCRGGIARSHERHATSGQCGVIAGIEAIHYYVGGRKPFKQPGASNDELLRRERDEIATFGRIATRHLDDYSKQQGYQVVQWEVIEEWSMVNESAAGISACHPLNQVGSRLSQGQLLAVRPRDAQGLLLGQLRWATVAPDANLHSGIQLFPGRPEAVAIRSTGLAAVKEPYRQAFLLPAVDALKVPPCVFIPVGWYRAERILEVFTDHSRQIRLMELLDRGADFDRVSYQALP